MKQCPQCKQTYSDENLNFCLSDGALLVSGLDSSDVATVIRPSLSVEKKSEPARQGVSPLFAYLTVGLFALLIGGAIVAWMKTDSNTPSAKNDSSLINIEDSNRKRSNTNSTPEQVKETKPASVSADTSALKGEVEDALNGWTRTLINRDFSNHMNYYAEKLDTYYKKKNVDISFVRTENLKLFEKYSTFGLSMSNLKTDVDSLDGQTAVTTFDSTYNFRGNKAFHSGVSQTEIRWKKSNGTWKITSERILRNYRVNK